MASTWIGITQASGAGQSSGGCFRRKKNKRSQVEDEVDGCTKRELAQRPEVRVINRYAVTVAYILMGMKGVGSLALLWASVVLLGGFVSKLNKKDFWYLTVMSFVQAAGLINALGGDQFEFFTKWLLSLSIKNLFSWTSSPPASKEESCGARLVRWMQNSIYNIGSAIIYFAALIIFFPVLLLGIYGPTLCYMLAIERLGKVRYGNVEGAKNLKLALNIFYSLSLAHGVMYFLWGLVQVNIGNKLVEFVSQRHGFSSEIVHGYFDDVKLKCARDPASTGSWNLITYGAGLLDSVLPDDYLRGARVLSMLIEKGIPVRRLLIRSPRHQIEKLIGTLGWRISVSADRETKGLAARIVAHLAGDLNLAQFPGALECISSLLETTGPNNGDQEALHFPTDGSQTMTRTIDDLVKWRWIGDTAVKGTNEDLILQGLRILENLAHDQHNCTEIYKAKGLLSKITSPVSSHKLIEDIEINAAWIKVVDGSLKVVSRLMGAPGDTGKKMRHQIANNSNAVENLEAVLGLESKSDILDVETRAIEVLAQLFLDEPINLTRERREHFIKRVLHFFLADKWMEDYLEEEKTKIGEETASQLEKIKHASKKIFEAGKKAREERVEEKMKEAQETASRHKEKAGEALAMLSMGSQSSSETIRSFTECGDVVHCLTEMLDSKIKTIECTGATETVELEIEIKIGCRISAAEILKNLCTHCTLDHGYVKEAMLKKVLLELLHIDTEIQAQAGSRSTGNTSTARINDIESPPPRGSDQHELATPRSHKQQSDERRLQAALLSLCAAIRTRCINAGDFASVIAQLTAREDFVGKLMEIVEENSSYTTPACLAIVKLACEMVISLIPHDKRVEEMEEKKEMINALSQASETMAGLESCMLFAGTDRDCYGVPVKPLSSVLVKQAQELLRQKEQELGMNTSAREP